VPPSKRILLVDASKRFTNDLVIFAEIGKGGPLRSVVINDANFDLWRHLTGA